MKGSERGTRIRFETVSILELIWRQKRVPLAIRLEGCGGDIGVAKAIILGLDFVLDVPVVSGGHILLE